MATYHIETYGCTSNQGESRRIERSLRDGGHRPADGPEEADVAILNTCTVVEKTERNMLRRAEELDDTTADLIVTGCMALAQGDCSYCITKFATGRIDSPPVADNVEKARALVHAGASEIRVTGQDTGVYGWDTGERKLPELLDRICDIDGEFRVRVGMANPGGIHGIHEELVEVFARNEELYNFIHLPVQSGSDDVLADMRRQHRVDGDRHEVLVVEQGTADSVKCRDGAYRQVIVQNASEHGVEPGEFREVEVTGQNTMYAFGELV